MSQKVDIDTAQARRLLNKGESYSSVARQLGTSARTLKRRLGEDEEQYPAMKVKALKSEIKKTREEIWNSWRNWPLENIESLEISSSSIASARWCGLDLRSRYFEDLEISDTLTKAFDDWERLVLRIAEVSVRLARDAKAIREADHEGVDLIVKGVKDHLAAEAKRVYGNVRSALNYQEHNIGKDLAERVHTAYADLKNGEHYRLWRALYRIKANKPDELRSMLGLSESFSEDPEIAAQYLWDAVGRDATAIVEALEARHGSVLGAFRRVVDDFEDRLERWEATVDCRSALDDTGGYAVLFAPLRLQQFAERPGGELAGVCQ